MKRKFRDYQEKLLEDLQDSELVHYYLNEALADEDSRMFLLALKNVHKSQGDQMPIWLRKQNCKSCHKTITICNLILLK